MKFDVTFLNVHLADMPELARRVESTGASGIWTSEAENDPFLPLPLAAEHTQRLQLGTAIAVAFARNPMTLAYTAWDLARQSQGRFILGLGTQVKPHITKRFSMPWPDSPLEKLRDMIAAIRAIWHSWQTGEPLNHRSPYHRHTLMTPFFNSGPIEHPNIPIYIAGVNPGLIRLAGETADGLHVHPFHTLRYLDEVIRPNVAAGAARAGRDAAACQLSIPVLVAVGHNQQTLNASRNAMRTQIAFYASTPTYRAVMDLHGWGDIADQLSACARRQQWNDMPALVSEDMLAECVVEGTWDDLGDKLRTRYQGIAARLSLYTPFTLRSDLDNWRKIAIAIQT